MIFTFISLLIIVIFSYEQCRKLAKAWASSSNKVRADLAGLGTVTNLRSELGSSQDPKQVGYPSWALLRLRRKLDFQSRLSSDSSDINQVFELGSSLGSETKFLARYSLWNITYKHSIAKSQVEWNSRPFWFLQRELTEDKQTTGCLRALKPTLYMRVIGVRTSHVTIEHLHQMKRARAQFSSSKWLRTKYSWNWTNLPQGQPLSRAL